MKKQKGISLIALIITIIVIIILAAIVIGGVFNTPAQAAFARFCNDISSVQESVNIAIYSAMGAVELQTSGEMRSSSSIYRWVATGDPTAITVDDIIDGKHLVLIGANNKLTTKLPEYSGQNWYIDVDTGKVYLAPNGFTYNGKQYMCQDDIGNGGTPIADSGSGGGESGGSSSEIEVVEAPAEDWEYDTSTGTIIKYIGSAVNPLVIPNQIDGTKMTILGNGYDSILDGRNDITSVSISQGIERINGNAFYSKSELVGSISIPNTVDYIGGGAFYGCEGLTSISFPNSLEYIGGYAFGSCTGLTSIIIPNSVTGVDNGAFDNCSNLKTISAPMGVAIRGDGYYTWPIELETFVGTGGTTLSEQAQNGYMEFYQYTNLRSVTIPASFTDIPESFFEGCTSLEEVIWYNGLESIGRYAFKDCENLTNISSIPSTVSSIDYDAFYGCPGCPHSWSYGSCMWCSTGCSHENWADGHCIVCGGTCDQLFGGHNWEDYGSYLRCSICGLEESI